MQFDLARTGAHWDFPERQPEKWPRERSIEHKFLTPVFGTSCPPKGLSGVLRKYAYARYSEARAAHWLILIGADRVDAIESHLRSFGTVHPDNPITETGVLSEFTRKGLAHGSAEGAPTSCTSRSTPSSSPGRGCSQAASSTRRSGRYAGAVTPDRAFLLAEADD
jgi:hypothetical protein